MALPSSACSRARASRRCASLASGHSPASMLYITGVAHGAVGAQRVVAHHAVFLGAQPLDGALAGEVEVVGAPAHHMAVQVVEGVAPAASSLAVVFTWLRWTLLGIPGVANLHPASRRAGCRGSWWCPAPCRWCRRITANGKAVAFGAHAQCIVDVFASVFGLGHRGDAQLP